jgi:hypothetical protein
MKKLLFLAALMLSITWTASAQLPVNNQVIYVPVAPSGACPASPPIEVVISTGVVYTCNNGTWAATSYSLPTATSSVLGGVMPDGTTILNTAGVISATPASIGAQVNLGATQTGAIGASGTATFPGTIAAGSETLGSPLLPASGGTGATTAAAALTSLGAAGTGIANTFTENQSMTGLTLSTVANAAAPTGVATNSGQSVGASTTNEAAVTCIDSSGANTTLGVASANVTTTGGSSYIVWSYTLPSGCTTGYIWMKNTGSFAYYSVATGTSFQQNAAATTYTAAASYPAGGAYPTANTTGYVNATTFASTVPLNMGIPAFSVTDNSTHSGSISIAGGGDNRFEINGSSGILIESNGNGITFQSTTGGFNSSLMIPVEAYAGADANANGSKAGFSFMLPTSTQNSTVQGEVSATTTDYRQATLSADLVFRTVLNGTLGEAFRIKGGGTISLTATAPTASAGSVAAYSSNMGGEITGLSAATSVNITFANSGWTNAAFCVVTPDNATAIPYISAISKTGFTITFTAAETGVVFYHCDGN